MTPVGGFFYQAVHWKVSLSSYTLNVLVYYLLYLLKVKINKHYFVIFTT